MERRASVVVYPGVTERHLCPKIVSVTYRTRSQFPVIGRALCAGEATINETVTLLESILGLNRLLDADQFDVEAALAFLNTLPPAVDAEIGGTIEHARQCVAAAPGGDHKHEAVARYTIKRVALVLERHLRQA